MKRILTAFLATAVAATGFGWSKDGENPWRKIDDSLVTPHRTFASPVSGKKNTVLILASGLGQRELVELKQRFDYRYFLLPVQDMKFFSPFDKKHKDAAGGSLYAAAMNAEEYEKELGKILSEELPQCDGIVLGKLPYSAIPEKVRNAFLEQVRKGAVLILIADKTKPQNVPGMNFSPVKIDFPTDSIPSLKGVKVEAADCGKGKVVILRYPGYAGPQSEHNLVESLTPFESDDPLYYDYCLAFLGKVFWHFMQPGRSAIQVVEGTGNVVLKNAPPAGSRIQYAVADKFGEELFNKEVPAAKTVQLNLPPLPNSARMLDVKLVDKDGGILDFQSAPVNAVASGTVKISLPKDGYLPDEPVSGKLSVAGDGTDAEVTLTDDFGRLLYKKQFRNIAAECPFTIQVPYCRSNYAVLDVKLMRNGKLFDEAREIIYYNKTKEIPDFAFGMWSSAVSNSRVVSLWLKEMARCGVDNVMDAAVMFSPRPQRFFAPRNLKRAGMDYAIYISRIVGNHYLAQTGKCPYNLWEKYQQESRFYDRDGKPLQKPDGVMEQVEGAKNIGVLFYNMGDENACGMSQKTENCFCKDCQRRFRDYLKSEYKTIDALNREYGTKYKGFEEVTALPFVQAVEKNLCPMWQDFRLFMEEQFIGWHRFEKAKIRSIDPSARCGIEGMVYPADPFTGFNLYKMLPYFEFCAPYFDPRDVHAVTKYMPKENSLKSAWFGTYEGEMTDQFVQQPAWRYLFGGLGGAFYWYSGDTKTSGAFSTACIAGPDLRMLTQFTKAAEEINRIKESGVGKLLMNSELRKDGILVHYSNNSLHSATINPDKSSWLITHKEFGSLLESLGLGYEFISPPELEKGIPEGTKILILPYSQSMSEKEAQAVRAFVNRGGMVVADYNPAIMSEHGRFLDKSQLSDVFGEFRKLNIHPYGKGLAVYLDDYLSGVDSRIQKNEASGIQNGMLRIFEKAGVRPFASVKDGQDKIQPVTVFEHGKTQYLCLLAQRSQTGEKRKTAAGAEAGASGLASVGGSFQRTVTLEKPMHVYDILNGNKYLGKVKEFTIELTPAVGRLFACSEVPFRAPSVRIPDQSVSRGEAVRIIPENIDNAAIVTVSGPDGKKLYEQRAAAGGEVRFVPALNDPAGTYKATVKDVVSGLSSSNDITVK